jgi:hypothetical protein
MRARTLLAATVVVFGLTGIAAPSAWAQLMTPPLDCGVVRTANATPGRVWITIYDLAKLRHLDYGWVEGCSFRDWRSGNYACGGFYHVRGEVKNWNDSANVFDTSMQINPQVKGMGVDVNSNVVVLRRGTGDNYYWAHGGDATYDAAGKVAMCDGRLPPGTPLVDVNFSNPTDKWAVVTVDILPPQTFRRLVNEDCVPPGQTKSWKLLASAEYSVPVAVHSGSCSGPIVGGNAERVKVSGPSVDVRLIYGLQQTR